jgi:hypothetical protein
MKPEEKQLLLDLLNGQRILALSVLTDGAPYTGLLPFAAMPDYTAVLIHASRLARHSQGLQPGAPYSAMIHVPDRPDVDPLQIPRVMLQGRVSPLDRGSEAHRAARDIYLARFPSSAQTFVLGDFILYALGIEDGRLVIGFARTVNLSPKTMRELADGE